MIRFYSIFFYIFCGFVLLFIPPNLAAQNIDSQNLLATAEQLYNSKKYSEAYNIYNDYITKNQNANNIEISVFYKAGKTAIKLKNYNSAIALLKKYLELNAQNQENNDNALYLLALAYFKNNDYNNSKNIKQIITNNYPNSPYNAEKYWTFLNLENIDIPNVSSAAEKQQLKLKKSEDKQPLNMQSSTPTSRNTIQNLDNSNNQLSPIYSTPITESTNLNNQQEEVFIPINTNIEYVLLDFDRALFKTIVEQIKTITKINYKLDFGSNSDFITLKSEKKISIKFLPILLQTFANDYQYDIQQTPAGSIISKKNDAIENQLISSHNFYYLSVYEAADFQKLKQSIEEIKNIEDIEYRLFPNFNYLLLKSNDLENIFKFLNSLKVTSDNLGKYKVSVYQLKNISSTILAKHLQIVQNHLDSINPPEIFNKAIKQLTKKEFDYKSTLTKSENIELIKNFKSISDNKENNSITISYPKEREKAVDSLIKSLDINLFKNESNLRVFKLKYADAVETVNQLKELFKDDYAIIEGVSGQETILTDKQLKQITADKRTNTILVIATQELLNRIETIITELDKPLALDNILSKIANTDAKSDTIYAAAQLSSAKELQQLLQQQTAETPRALRLYYIKNNRADAIKKHFDDLFKNNNILNIYSVSSDEKTNALAVIADPNKFSEIDTLIIALDTIEKPPVISAPEKQRYTYSLRYRSAEYIKTNFDKIKAEGYFKDQVSITPIDKQNKLILIAETNKGMQQLLNWLNIIDNKPAQDLDVISQIDRDNSIIQTFIYQCKNLPADDLSAMLNSMIKSIQSIQSSAISNENDYLISQQQQKSIQRNLLLSSNVIINADKTTNSIIINASNKDYRHLIKLLENLDKIPDQIQIDVIIAEVSLTDKDQFGFEWQYGASNIVNTNFSMRSSESLSNNLKVLSNGLRYSVLDTKKFNAFMNFMETNSKIRILSRPSITTVHNKRALIKIGQEVPITKITQSVPTGSEAATIQANNYLTQYTEFKDVGISLEVTPTSIDNDNIGLNLHLIVSEVDESKQMVGTITNPTIRKREAETVGAIKSMNTLVIGGLLKQDELNKEMKVPVLGDIPLVGNLFKRNERSKENTELIIFITPTLMKNNVNSVYSNKIK